MSKILICYVKAGGGHYSAAKALKANLEAQYPNKKVELYNVLQGSKPNSFNTALDALFNNLYIFLVERLPILWKLIIFLATIKPISWLFKATFNRLIRTNLRNKIWSFEPDLVISTYYFINSIVINNLRNDNKKISTITVVTDTFSPHSIWFLNKKDKFIVNSKEAFAIANKHIKNKDQIYLSGYCFNQKFNSKMEINKVSLLKIKLGLSGGNKTVLILGGGGGLKDGNKIYNAIAKKARELNKFINIIVVCGSNKKMEKQILKSKSNFNKQNKTLVYGFADNVYELINLCDVVVSKAGPATVLESLALEKKIFLSSYIPDQEKGNKDFVVNNKLGFYSTNFEELAIGLFKYLDDPHADKKFKLHLKKQKIKSDIPTVTTYLHKLSIQNQGYSESLKYL